MLPYKNLIIIDKNSEVPIYKQISIQFIDLIQEGKLLPGSKLPSTRSLALDLHLHRKTIMAVYETLVSEDWIDSQPRKGYIVSPNLPVVRPRSYHKKISPFSTKGKFDFDRREIIHFTFNTDSKNNIIIDDGFPDTSLLPFNTINKEFRKSLDRVITKDNSKYALDSAGFKNSLQTFLNQTRGIDFSFENLFITRGGQMAIYLSASLIIKPGDKIVVTEPSYFIADALFEKLGADIIRVPVDDQGMRTDILEDILKKQTIKLIYVIPHHHHPTTVTMSVERRNHLLELINIYNPAVIEDDYDYDFQFKYDPYLPLASGDHNGNIIYIGSLTKVLGTPFRLGYMIATEEFLAAVSKLRILIDLKGDLIIEQTVAAMINSGDLARHIQKTNKIYSQRCDLLCNLLNEELNDYINYSKPSGGLAVWLSFKPEYELSKIIKHTHENGLSVKSNFYCTGKNAHYNSFRFGFASMEEKKITDAVRILKNSVKKMY